MLFGGKLFLPNGRNKYYMLNYEEGMALGSAMNGNTLPLGLYKPVLNNG